MQFHGFLGIDEFLVTVTPYLEREEAVNNLMLGLCQADNGRARPDSRQSFLAYVEAGGEVTFAMAMTPPHNMIVSSAVQTGTDPVPFAVKSLVESGITIPGIIGPSDVVREFAAAWSEHVDCLATVTMRQRIYQLDRVEPVAVQAGRFRPAVKGDLSTLAHWYQSFSEDIGEPIERAEAEKTVMDSIGRERLFVWDVDGEPVSMAAKARELKYGTAVSHVYTPREFRHQGYATSCVALLSQHILDSGQRYCYLYTDLGNPVSNSIYMRIGYKPRIDSTVMAFTARE